MHGHGGTELLQSAGVRDTRPKDMSGVEAGTFQYQGELLEDRPLWAPPQGEDTPEPAKASQAFSIRASPVTKEGGGITPFQTPRLKTQWENSA